MRPRYDTHRRLHALWSPVGHPDKPTVSEHYGRQLVRFEYLYRQALEWDTLNELGLWTASLALTALRKEARD